jgi:hypothetical protein
MLHEMITPKFLVWNFIALYQIIILTLSYKNTSARAECNLRLSLNHFKVWIVYLICSITCNAARILERCLRNVSLIWWNRSIAIHNCSQLF